MSRQVVILIYIKTWRKDSKELGEKSHGFVAIGLAGSFDE
jgi:hypothetical protein